MERKILVAVDGSIHSTHAVNYLSSLFPRLKDIHLHLLSLVPSSLPPGHEWRDEMDVLTTMPATVKNKYSAARRYVKDAVNRLQRNGFTEEQLSTDVRLTKFGTARDILFEARQGLYDALVIGRRGITKIEEIFMGSVSKAILDKCHDIPIWIIDGDVKEQAGRFLVPVDGSFHSLLAVDHLSHILRDNPYAEITLFHSSAMFANKVEIDPQQHYEKWGKEWCDRYLTGPDSLHAGPKKLLMDAGIKEDRIFWLHAFKGIEASRQIIRQALIDDFGTIVMGRRGEDAKKGLFKGVSDRVIYMAEHVAIWIVG